MLGTMSKQDLAVTMATIANAAYTDDCSDLFKSLGFNKSKFVDNTAHGHVASSDTEVIISCRGTQPTHIMDLLADLDTIPKRHGKGWVHEGFRRYARYILDDIIAWVEAAALPVPVLDIAI